MRRSIARAWAASSLLGFAISALLLPGLPASAATPGPDRHAATSAAPGPVTIDLASGRRQPDAGVGDGRAAVAALGSSQMWIGDIDFVDREDGGLELYGEVYNPGRVPLGTPSLRVTYYDAGGNVVAPGYSERMLHFIVLEGQSVGHFSSVDIGLGDAVQLTVQVTGVPVGKVPLYSEVTDIHYPVWNDSQREAHFTASNAGPYAFVRLLDVVAEYDIAEDAIVSCFSHGRDFVEPGHPEMAVGDSFEDGMNIRTSYDAGVIEQYIWTEGEKAAPVTPRARVSGADRVLTAVAASKAAFADDSCGTVIVVSGSNYADALSASALAGIHGSPILLSTGTTLRGEVASEIMRLGAEKVIVVGGTGAVPDSVLTGLRSAVASEAGTRRISGADRYATCAKVLEEVALESTGPMEAFVVRGDAFADALSVSSYAWSERMPVVLVRPGSIPLPIQQAVEATPLGCAWVVGGTGAVSDATARALGVPWTRLGGSDRYDTCAVVAAEALDNGWTNFSLVGVASGATFPDALSAGPALGARGGALVLTAPDVLPRTSYGPFLDNCASIGALEVFGGTGAVSGIAADMAHYLCL